MSVQETSKYIYDLYSDGVTGTEKLSGMSCAVEEGNGRTRSPASHSASISGISRFLGHLCAPIHSYSLVSLICLFVVPMRQKKITDIKTLAMFPPN